MLNHNCLVCWVVCTHVGQQLVGRHAGHDDQVADDDLQVVGPTRAQRRPQLLDLFRVVVRELNNIILTSL